jgi:inositol-1,3,4-trisphosphate 5/6-kinase/inositol-tetrakisphosphate 1-kinase
MAERPRKRLGFHVSKSKQKNLNWPQLVARAQKEFHLDFVELDMEKDLDSQGVFDVLLLKWNQQLAKIMSPEPDKDILAKVNRVLDYVKKNPRCRVVDPIESQMKIMKRDDVVHIFKELDRRNSVMKCPSSVTLASKADYGLLSNVMYPVIVKAIEGGGTEESHRMGIAFNEKCIADFTFPVLVQEFLNHNATIEKVFVIGDEVRAVRRPSLPNFEPDPVRETLMFNSQAFDDILGHPGHYNVQDPQPSILKSISKDLTEITGLTLYGYDLILDTKSGKYAVIDINFFPGFDGFDDFEGNFLRHLAK